MGLLILIFIIFIITVAMIVVFSPDIMAEEESYKTKVENIWRLVKLCQTASFGFPSLNLIPAKRSVVMDLHFLDADILSMTIPLRLKKQQKAKASYLELLTRHNIKVVDLDTKLIMHLNRKDENLPNLVAHLYKEIFEASDSDTVKFTVKTLKSDMRVFRLLNNPNQTFNETYKFEASSAKYNGKSVLRVLAERILGAVYFLLYPPLIIATYKFGGLMSMCWAALAFFGFFAIYNPIYKKTSVLESMLNGSLLYCILLAATLFTEKLEYLQSIPSVIGVSTAVIALALVLGLKKPWSTKQVANKKNNPREFKFMQSFWVLGGVGLFLASEWARRNLTMEDWVSFFGFVRIELMIVMVIIFTPAYALFLKREGHFR